MYIEQFQIIARRTGRALRAFDGYAQAVAEFGSEGALRKFCRKNNAETAFVSVRRGSSGGSGE